MMQHFACPTEIVLGPGARQAVKSPGKSALLLTSRSLPDAIVQGIEESLRRTGCHVTTCRRDSGEPDSAAVDALAAGVPTPVEGVVGVGGGSTLDCAKALALVLASGGGVADYEFGARPMTAALPLALLPTTCGSGSEVTPYAVINNHDTGRKFTLSAPCLRAGQACLDPDLLAGLPLLHVRATALDAFLHCLEAALGRQRQRLLEPLAVAGLGLVRRHLPAALSGAPPANWAEPLARAALYGGLCIGNSRTGLVHTLSVALAPYTALPHGLLAAWLAPRGLAYNVNHYQGRLAVLASAAFETRFASDGEAARDIGAWLTRHLPPDTARKALARPFAPEAVTARVLEDAGLPEVNARPLSPQAIARLVGEIAHGAF